MFEGFKLACSCCEIIGRWSSLKQSTTTTLYYVAKLSRESILDGNWL